MYVCLGIYCMTYRCRTVKVLGASNKGEGVLLMPAERIVPYLWPSLGTIKREINFYTLLIDAHIHFLSFNK